MSENPEVRCPECDAAAEKKIGAGAGIVFKGSGFYVNDYKNKKPQDNKKPPTNKAENANQTKTSAKPGQSAVSKNSNSNVNPSDNKQKAS